MRIVQHSNSSEPSLQSLSPLQRSDTSIQLLSVQRNSVDWQLVGGTTVSSVQTQQSSGPKYAQRPRHWQRRAIPTRNIFILRHNYNLWFTGYLSLVCRFLLYVPRYPNPTNVCNHGIFFCNNASFKWNLFMTAQLMLQPTDKFATKFNVHLFTLNKQHAEVKNGSTCSNHWQ